MNIQKRLKDLGKSIVIMDDRIGYKANKKDVRVLSYKIDALKSEITMLRNETVRHADINQLQNEINDIKASLNAVKDAEKAVEEAKISNQFIKESVLPDTDIKYEPITVPTGGVLQRSVENKKPTLVIWLPDGRTLFFHEVSDFEVNRDPNEGTMSFSYFGLDTQVLRKARFKQSLIMGYALQVI